MREESKFRKSDENIENINNQYLDSKFYKSEVDSNIRITDKKLQVKGVDTIFNLNEKQYICDEKVAAHYINKNLQTFAFELSFINRSNDVQDGWLIDKNKLNNSYLLCWLDKAVSDNPVSVDEIQESEIVLVTRESILTYLNSIHWDNNKLKLKAHSIRYGKDTKFGNILENGVKFSFSEKLVEKPINIILSREILRQIADYKAIL